MKTPQPFSQELHRWLKSDKHKTLGELQKVFAEKAFAVSFLILMFIPALPLPTGGITHVAEIMTMLLALELTLGRRDIWLPKRWLHKDVGHVLSSRAVRTVISWVQKAERLSSRRGADFLAKRIVLSGVGVVVLVFTMASFLAPPFSGLDTLPALGVIIVSLALILEDSMMLAAGVAVGLVGVGLVLTAGVTIYRILSHFL